MNHAATTNCVWGQVERFQDGSARMLCVDCGDWTPKINGDLTRICKNCPAKKALLPVRMSVGTKLREIIHELRVGEQEGCQCAQLELELNIAGPALCRAERAAILVRLRKNAGQYGIKDWMVAAVAAIRRGMTFIRVRDILGSLLDEAIRRAEAIEANGATGNIPPEKLL
jgi:hypothetical protein